MLLLLLLAGSLYNAAAVWRLSSLYPVPGKFFEVNGSKMHLYCTGSGSPTVVLESGLGGDWLVWQKVQPGLEKTTRVCSYDRAGLGWSDPQPGPRDAKDIALQLHALLQQAGETGPLVLAGASAGGFYVRQFVADYPTEVAGIVFVDASTPEQIEALPGAKDSEPARAKRHRDADWDWLKDATGWARITGHCNGEVEKGLEAYANIARAGDCRPSFAVSWLGEWDSFWISGEQAAAVHCCGNIPMVILSQDPDRPKPGWTAQAIAAQPIWVKLQEQLKTLSPHSRRIVARGSRHHVADDHPDVVISATQRLIAGIRNQVTDPEDGTTVVQ
jgi:pimeloyl-ACP methyl ester carboxylesterase